MHAARHTPSSASLLRRLVAAPRTCRAISSSSSLAVTCTHAAPSLPPRVRVDRRTFVSTSTLRAALAQKPKAAHAELVAYPSPSSLRTEEDEDEDAPDVDYVPPREAVLSLTDRAAEQLRSVAQRDKNPDAALRVSVESGGCHGYQYKMVLAKERQQDDYHFSHPRIKPSNIYVDVVSMALLKGSTIDFATELIGSSFRVVDNPQATDNGCGCGVSWELKA
ncbi:hypothetical protein L226DRAFT_473722 [Lentinus tigrinus ALCF2SS1-7]|uniref:Core domain-containing protein n=1 Tax=Lentinus tigrinus ALCF2SS1-6 TaxID=1328759 RepID=A0A5C2RQT4_9APHY|nr:hypothetical protein L227DRAFT_658617 [Lentinus tigrinus ALCF2SS1-6]RPD68262.1 hypothetical protein L226DRAFT_473722 [Lentinus tigrinus ALCF2SS1-7]